MKDSKEYMRIWRKNNPEKVKKYREKYYGKKENVDKVNKKHREYYMKSKEKHRKRVHKYNLKKKYGITVEDFNQMLKKQNNKCAICNEEFNKDYKPCVDHNHETGEVRGLLCRKCNLALYVVENKYFVLKAQEYLESK